MIIFRVIWAVNLILPFFFLPFLWALLVIAILFLGTFPLGLLILSVLKPLFGHGHSMLDYSEGLAEAAFYTLIVYFLHPPQNFLLVIVFLYTTNQVNRIFRYNSSIQEDEVRVFTGFFIGMGIMSLLSLVL